MGGFQTGFRPSCRRKLRPPLPSRHGHLVKIGIFGGSFDPVHHGHLILARDAVEQLGLDQLRLIPAGRNPLKDEIGISPPDDRLAMLKTAIQGETRIEVDEFEIRRPPPSYTIETLRDLRERFPDAELHLLIGADNLAVFETWNDHEAIRLLARLVVFGRSDSGPGAVEPDARLHRLVDLSSTEIRTRVASGKSIQYLVPSAVAAYIDHHHLYRFEHQLS